MSFARTIRRINCGYEYLIFQDIFFIFLINLIYYSKHFDQFQNCHHYDEVPENIIISIPHKSKKVKIHP